MISNKNVRKYRNLKQYQQRQITMKRYTDTVGIFNESDADTSSDFTKLMPINAGDRIDKH